MKTGYKKGDIVELLNFNIDEGGEGYYINQAGLIPIVGHRYYVGSEDNEDNEDNEHSVLLLGRGLDHNGRPRTFFVYTSQIKPYKYENLRRNKG